MSTTEIPFPKVSVITLTWNQQFDTMECVRSLKRLEYPNFEIIIVDNGSIDNSIKVFKENFGDRLLPHRSAVMRNFYKIRPQ